MNGAFCSSGAWIDLAPYRAAIEADVPCVMVGHGVYPSLGGRRAVVEASTYRLLRDD